MHSDDAVRRIADAVLYEGYLLWPYRKLTLKNQQRFTFGGVYPPAWEDRSSIQAQVLLEGDEHAEIEVRVRFLHVVQRQVLKARPASGSLRPEEPDPVQEPQPVEGLRSVEELQPVEELEAGGERWISWEEAREREFAPGPIRVHAGEQLQRVSGGAIRRSWQALEGELAVTREALRPGCSRVTVRVVNATPWMGDGRQDALRQTFCSTHAVLHARDGAWVSPTDPPAALRADTQACENAGVWPVLVGGEGERDTMLASPIILSDYPQIAPESPGNLFDSGEIDQMLVLNILAMTEQERRDMRDSDPRAREILERTEALSEAEIMRLGGAVREFGLVRGR